MMICFPLWKTLVSFHSQISEKWLPMFLICSLSTVHTVARTCRDIIKYELYLCNLFCCILFCNNGLIESLIQFTTLLSMFYIGLVLYLSSACIGFCIFCLSIQLTFEWRTFFHSFTYAHALIIFLKSLIVNVINSDNHLIAQSSCAITKLSYQIKSMY